MSVKADITKLLVCKATVALFNENLIIALKICLPEREEAINEIWKTMGAFSGEIDNKLLEALSKEREELAND